MAVVAAGAQLELMPADSPGIRIATWNVNSVRARVKHLTDWLREAQPDVLLLQEIKCLPEEFPSLEVGDLGYNVQLCGQKSYNGVAILSKHRVSAECMELPGEPEKQSRYIEGVVEVPGGRTVRVASIYLPNGNPVGTDRFDYKLAWMEALREHLRARLQLEEIFVAAGDFNIVPTDFDVWNADAVRRDALMQPEARLRYRALLNLGYVDAYRTLHPAQRGYTFWDYQAGAWRKNQGWRIDHMLLSPQAADRLEECAIDTGPRAAEKPSDHTPVWCRLTL